MHRREPESNIVTTCAECAREMYRERYTRNDVKVGGFVKKLFGREHMWVEVTALRRNGIRGKVSNDPVLPGSPDFGDRVFVPYAEIEDVSEG